MNKQQIINKVQKMKLNDEITVDGVQVCYTNSNRKYYIKSKNRTVHSCDTPEEVADFFEPETEE